MSGVKEKNLLDTEFTKIFVASLLSFVMIGSTAVTKPLPCVPCSQLNQLGVTDVEIMIMTPLLRDNRFFGYILQLYKCSTRSSSSRPDFVPGQ